MDLKDRIATIIKVNQHTATSFADLIGVQRSSVSHILNGRNKPSLDFIEKLLVQFPRVDADWLITGRNPGKASNPEQKIKGNNQNRINPAVAIDSSISGKAEIEKIVVFFSDSTFATYEPK